MADLGGVLVRERRRLREFADILRTYGLGPLAGGLEAAGGAGFRSWRPLSRWADPHVSELTTGERVRGALTEMGTTWIKFGQMLSVRPDIVGVDVAAALATLQSSVPSDPAGYVIALVESELGAPVGELFASFDEVAMASGSVAQVHRATTHAGEQVVVKVLHRGVERKVASDLELMAALVDFLEGADPELARYRPGALVADFDATLRGAIDLRRELSHLRHFAAGLAHERDVVVPKPLPELSSRRVLTMELMDGARLVDAESVRAAGWEVDALARRTAEVYLAMVFRDGTFHADPHPGNFLLRRGEVVILDFGDVGSLPRRRRQQLEEFLVALAGEDTDRLVDAVIAMTGAGAGSVDRDRLGRDVEAWAAQHLETGVADVDVGALFAGLMRVLHQHHLQLPPELAMLFRVLVLLQGLAQLIGARTDLVELLRPHLEELALQRLSPAHLADQAARTLREADRRLRTAADDIGELLTQARDGRVGVDIALHDPDEKIDQLIDGMLVSALTLGAAQMLARTTRPVLGTVSLPGALAAGLGAVMYQRLRGKRSSHLTLGNRGAAIVHRGITLFASGRRRGA